MATKHDHIALEWVRDEIDQTLVLARNALEAYAKDRSETTQANFCLSHIHQIYGTLQMIEFNGAALLAEEMENLCLALIEARSVNEDEALETLMAALLQLENYVAHMQTVQQDMPMMLLPILNDLRAAQGQHLLSDSSLFLPDLSAAQLAINPSLTKRMEDPQVLVNLRKLRQIFQVSLAGIIRNQNLEEHLGHLSKVVARLENFCKGSPLGQLWRVASAFVEVLKTEEQIGSAMKHLLRELDSQLKKMIDQPELALVSEVAIDTLKNLLYYVAKSEATLDKVAQVKIDYALADTVPDESQVDEQRAKMMGPDKGALSSISQLLVEELTQVKEQIDLYGRDKDASFEVIANLEPGLQQISSTLAVLGLNEARNTISELLSTLQSAEQDGLNEQQLMDAANALLQVEAHIDHYQKEDGNNTPLSEGGLPPEQIQAAHGALLSESKIALEEAKTSILNFITSKWDHSEIESVPKLLDTIRGGLQMIPLTEASELLSACSAYISESILAEKRVPDWAQMDRLADTISSIEYYIERVGAGASENDRLLAVARESLEKLGYFEDAGQEAVISEHHVAHAASEAPDAEIKDTDEELLDDEILSIFVEEVGDVRGELNTALTALRESSHSPADSSTDSKAMTLELCRAFHTLKGSGRLVAASEISEIAWSLEDRINKAVDADNPLTTEDLDLAEAVYDALPAMLEAFTQNKKSNEAAELEARIASLNGESVSVAEVQAEQPAEPEVAQVTEVTEPTEEPVEQDESVEAPSPAPVVSEAEDDDLIDDEILEIFIEEAEEVSDTINEFLPAFLEDFENQEALAEIRRAYHTLKGSGRMVQAELIGETAWAVENLLNRVIDKTIPMSQPIADLLNYVSANIPGLVEAFKQRSTPDFDRAEVESYAEAIQKGEEPSPLGTATTSSEQSLSDEVPEQESPASEVEPAAEGDQALIDELPEVQVEETDSDINFDQSLLDIFEGEALAHVVSVEEFANAVPIGESIPVNDLLSRALHTLKGTSNTANIIPIAEIAIPLEHMVKDARENKKEVDQAFAAILLSAMSVIRQGVEQIRSAPQQAIDGASECIEAINFYHQEILAEQPEVEEFASDAGPDPQLVSIFLTEGVDILLDAERIIDDWLQDNISDESFDKLVNEVTVLGRGAKVAALAPIAQICEGLEGAYAQFKGLEAAPSPSAVQLIKRTHDALIDMMDQTAAGLSAELDENLLDELSNIQTLLVDDDQSVQVDSATSDGDLEPDTAEIQASEPAALEPLSEDLDAELVEIFLEEAQDLIQNSAELLHKWEEQPDDFEVLAELQRDLHTLKGGARMAELNAIGDLSHELETLFEKSVEAQKINEPGVISLCLQCHDSLALMVDQVVQGYQPQSRQDLIDAVQGTIRGKSPQLAEQTQEPEPAEVIEFPAESASESPEVSSAEEAEPELEDELLALFLDESRDILSAIHDALDAWREDTAKGNGVMELQREFHTLKGGARLADLDAIANIADAAESAMDKHVVGEVQDVQGLQVLIDRAHGSLLGMMDQIHTGAELTSDDELLAGFASLDQVVDGEEPQQHAETTPEPASAPVKLSEDVDPEVLEMFAEEAIELSESLEENISQWSGDASNQTFNAELQRILHTLKGGARLASFEALADVSHNLETRLIAAQNKAETFDGDLQKEVNQAQDQILKLVDSLGSISVEAEDVAESADTPEKAEAPAIVAEETKSVEKIIEASAAESAEAPAKPAAKAKKSADKKAAPAKKTANASPQESIRVSAGLLDSLVNLAGETSISRGRLEQQVSDFGFTLEEMAATIERLREQLRRMEMETEAQVLYRAEQEGFKASDYEEFDPLEMDRYSSIQQLSRSLTESTTDLQELRDTLSNRARDAETLLLQQSRINSELQEGLMKTRMIPFSSIVPRLRRIVRQISTELDKQVDFDVINADGEMDRSILERMIAPIEHMLRNALDHGIESKEQRKQAGKNEVGRIELSLNREGGDIVLRMSDDGGGIDPDRIFEKAVKQGLLQADTKPSRPEILQCIMQPGFSTAEKVTQISGRGVGMDVVASEIKQMGGVISIDSEVGNGSEFSVRLPFTVSVNRALMVSTGEDFYAIPLNTIEGIVRIGPYELEEYYKPDAPLYEYAGRQYNLQYLGKLLHSSHQPKLAGQQLPLPVILVRGADQPMALQVDQLMGSREIVVKSLGPQFSAVHGVSGGTILGDGSVVVILDLPALIRDEQAGLLTLADVQEETQEKSETPLVMVIDDSVTVRKVTSRLLERNGMDVVTAKDGVDAIAQLQDCKPDVMLLDIEMPRMDGFEVASLVRHDERLKDVPIIMITSRTGQKHRERALSIGVNEYLGKPFQEQQLLATIDQVRGVGVDVAETT